MQCSALLCNVVHYFTVSIHFKLQKSYLHLLLPGHWRSKYSFPWEKVHNHCKELFIYVKAPVLFCWLSLQKTQNTIKCTAIDIQKNSVLRGLQPCLSTAMTPIKNFDHSWFQTSAMFWMLYFFFWVIPQFLNFICRHSGTLCLFHLHRGCKHRYTYTAYEDGTECSETSAYKIQMPGNHPKKKNIILIIFNIFVTVVILAIFYRYWWFWKRLAIFYPYWSTFITTGDFGNSSPFCHYWILYTNISEHSVCSIFMGDVTRRITRMRLLGYLYRKRFGSKIAWAKRK